MCRVYSTTRALSALFDTIGSVELNRQKLDGARQVSVVLRLDPAELEPTVDVLADVLDRPARPLFIGRKCCLPSGRIFNGWVDAPDARTALQSVLPDTEEQRFASWPCEEGSAGAYREVSVTDERNWMTGLHGGARHVCEGCCSRDMERLSPRSARMEFAATRRRR